MCCTPPHTYACTGSAGMLENCNNKTTKPGRHKEKPERAGKHAQRSKTPRKRDAPTAHTHLLHRRRLNAATRHAAPRNRLTHA